MFMVTKGLLKKDVPSSGGSLATITGSAGAAKIPVQILEFTQNVTAPITIPSSNTYGLLKVDMGSHDIDGGGDSCFTNDNTRDIEIHGSGTIDAGGNLVLSYTGSTSAAQSTGGTQVSIGTGSTYYTSFSTNIYEAASTFVGGQSSGTWTVTSNTSGLIDAQWNAYILDGDVTISGVCDKKSLTIYKNGAIVLSLSSGGGSWSVNASQGDRIGWYCHTGQFSPTAVTRLQTWSFSTTSGSPNIAYYFNDGAGSSGSVTAKTIAVYNFNADELEVTLNSGTTGITSDTALGYNSFNLIQPDNFATTTSWSLAYTIASQTVDSVLYSSPEAFDGTGVTSNVSGEPSDGIDLTNFTGDYSRKIR
jgi:hypothetical protein